LFRFLLVVRWFEIASGALEVIPYWRNRRPALGSQRCV